MTPLHAMVVCALPFLANGAFHKINTQSTANPIRKVVNLLTAMKAKVQAEGEQEEKAYQKLICYCRGGSASLQEDTAKAEDAIPDLNSEIESRMAAKDQLKSQVSSAEENEQSVKSSLETATTVHEKTQSKLQDEEHEYEVDIDALGHAVQDLQRSGFFQDSSKLRLKRLASTEKLSEDRRTEFMTFLDDGRLTAGGVGEATGMLNSIREDYKREESTVEKDAKTERDEFAGLSEARKQEIRALDDQIEMKTQRIGELAVSIATKQNDLEDTENSLAEDKKLSGHIDAACAKKKKEFEENAKMRTMEIAAISDTVKMLSDDAALEKFKKALPGPSASFLEVAKSNRVVNSRAQAILRQVKSPSARLDLISLALSGSKLGFEKVIQLVDGLKATLEKEQADDEAKNAYCSKELDASDDQKKEAERQKSAAEAAVADAKEELAALTTRVEALEAGLQALDKSIAEATSQRDEEHAEYKQKVADAAAAEELLTLAKDRLSKFYESAVPTFTQVFSHTLGEAGREAGLLAGLAAASPYEKSQASGGVLSAIALLIKDMDKDMAVAKTEESKAQADYEKTMKGAASKRAADLKTLTDEKSDKADLQSRLEGHNGAKAQSEEELLGIKKYITALHTDCDFLLKYFSARKLARSDEIDGLIKARAVLANADLHN